jgi:hypothetical protein
MNKKALILIIVGLIILVGIIYFIFIYDFSPEDSTTTETTSTTEQNQIAPPIISKTSPTITQTAEPLSLAEQSREEANKLALYFAERYGTSSSQSNFQNLVDLKVFMTESYKATTSQYVATEQAKATAADYESIVTTAVIVEFTSFSETAGTAQGLVKTKRRQTSTDGQVKDFEQDLAISLEKIGSEWKVARASWK